MKSIISIIIITSFLFVSCEKREDIFIVSNQAPILEVYSSSTITSFTSTEILRDSFNLSNTFYYINYRIIDDNKNSVLSYSSNTNTSIELVNESSEMVKDKYITTGVLKVTPTTLGLRSIDLIVADPYHKQTIISIVLNVYRLNMIPTIHISTGGNVGSTNQGYVDTNITDTFNFSQGIIYIDYKVVDENMNYNFYFTTTNNGNIIEELSLKNTTYQTYTTTTIGQLKLTPTLTGNHLITIWATDDINQTKTITAKIIIQ